MSTTMTIRRRSKRSAAAPPSTPNSRVGRYPLRTAIETRNGSLVCEATSSGPAASTMPSPMLLTVAAASSQRKLRPSLAGTMVSVGRAMSDDTGGRIPTGSLGKLGEAPEERLRPGLCTSPRARSRSDRGHSCRRSRSSRRTREPGRELERSVEAEDGPTRVSDEGAQARDDEVDDSGRRLACGPRVAWDGEDVGHDIRLAVWHRLSSRGFVHSDPSHVSLIIRRVRLPSSSYQRAACSRTLSCAA